ncbi:methyltransferase domain-containing protein [Limobrevibacterium gyesilva]|uniref:Methyltransferase domain-containing protein n=1 Tax=Limobrevibacterium gyesilva TaxID=2991712 RepID=A0AA42CEB8_9PROT|nr:methyltransferase domain-containing protein [Limobrevibacterium gyesilva]MCW3473311.1 methyltransferase domain-containing protein [Limobrevibacterium gyesilva]
MAVYADAANPDLLKRIPLNAMTVLDVGCGTGALGAEYKRRNPAVRYLGIETDIASARIASQRLDEVATIDVEAGPLPFDDKAFDCIIYGDVLEHLRDPWSLLLRHAELLSPTGTILICLPNVEHWSFAERLLRGTWDYEEQGLFDKTHLRWFNFETTRRALRAAGLVIRDVTPRIFDLARAQEFMHALRPALETLGIDPQHYLQRAAPLQYVWRAGRQPIQQIHVVSTMLAPVGGVSHVRVVEPLRAMETDPAVTTRIVNGFDTMDLPETTPRIFVFHRPLLTGEAGLVPVRTLIDRGYLVVCEFDDHPDYIPVLQRPDVQNFRAVHAVQTSTEPLAEVLRRQNPEVAVFPNAVSRLPSVRNYATPGRLTLFFGGLNREEDWPPFLPALNAVAALAGERLHFQIVNDRGLFEALQTPHKSFTPLCDYETYQELLSRSEISFMPLLDSPFNRCKSDLKFLEAAAFRVTALASPVVYGDTIEDGHTGVLFHDARDLQQRLLRLIANPDIGQTIADAARSYVAKHRMLAYQVARRTSWYRSLWARREALQQSLLARVPELAQPAMPLNAD